MKKVLFIIILLSSALSLFAQFYEIETIGPDFASKDIAFSVAEEKISAVYGNQNLFLEPVYLFGLDDSLYAYMFLFSFDNSISNLKGIFSEIEARKSVNDEQSLSLLDKMGYIIISARYENNVILEYGRGLPYAFSKFSSIKNSFKLQDEGKLYYTGHGRFFFEDKGNLFDLAEYKTYAKIPYQNSGNISSKWKSVLSKSYKISSVKTTPYIADVPFVLWSYGCSPTTSSMIFSYYDTRGYGDFVDFYFTRYDNVMEIYRNSVPSAQRELSVLMYTDSVNDGGTSVSSIKSGNQNFANASHPYSFVCGSHIYGQTGDNFFYPYIKAEVDSQRPAHWAVLDYYYSGDYIGHSIVSIGYDDSGSDTLIQIHNTWDYTEPFWNLYTNVGGTLSYSCFYEIKPSGGNSFRTGNLNINGRKYFKGLTGIVNFTNLSDSLNSIKLYYSTDNFAHKNYIGESFDTLIVLTPSFNGSTNFSAEFLKLGGALLATDGTFYPINVNSIDDTNNLLLKSYTYDNSSAYSSLLKGDTLIVLAGNGIREYLLTDETLPQLIYSRNDGNTYKSAQFLNDTIILAGIESGVFSMKRKNGYTDIDTFYTSGSLADFEYKDGVVLAVSASALYALNINPDFSFSPSDTFAEGSRKQYTSVSVKDSFVYLTDLLNGIYIMKTEFPSSGFYGNYLYSTSYNEAFADIKSDTLYLACLNSGVSSYLINADYSLNFIDNKAIGAVNKVKVLQSGLACFNNSLGASLRCYGTMTDLSHLYMNSKITDINENIADDALYFADNSNGLFIGAFDPMAGVGESVDLKKTFYHVRQFSAGKIIIEYNSTNTEFGKAFVFNTVGRLVYSENIYFRITNSSVSLNADLQPGVYFVRIECGNGYQTEKTTLIK